MSKQINSNGTLKIAVSDIQRQRVEWRRKGWSIPDLRGGKQTWFSLINELVELVGAGQATDLDAVPNLHIISNQQSWRSYASFLKVIGLANNQAGTLVLSDAGTEFLTNPTQRQLANLIQDRIRLFGEVLELLSLAPATIEEVDEQLCKAYELNWSNLSNTRRRMDWLEVLDLIEVIGNRKWKITVEGVNALKDWCLVTPKFLEIPETDSSDVEIAEPPAEISFLLQRLEDSPENHKKRSTYNIWVPSPNRIENLRIIIQAASERIARVDLFRFIEDEFNLKTSSVESMLPFLKVSGLLEEVGRNIYLATPAANAWIGTGNDLDFIRIFHSNMQFVGEMIKAAENDIVRNDIYAQAKLYGLNVEKARWIVGFLLEAGLLEETQYLHLKATLTGKRFVAGLPLAERPVEEHKERDISNRQKDEVVPLRGELEQIIERLNNSSRDPGAEGKASGVAFEEAIAQIFCFMGFDAKRIGGSGDTDVILQWKNDEGKIIIAIVDGKSKSSGQVSHSDISDVAIGTHKDKNNADFVGIIGSFFSGDTIRNHARKKEFALITDMQLADIARASESFGLSPQEIGIIFQVPNGLAQLDEFISLKQRELEIISIVISRFSREQKILGCLSPRDLFLLLRDTNVSPSLNELLNVFENLSRPEIGILRTTDKSRSPNTMYMLIDPKKTANRLRALATAIEKSL
ncbi:restriction endonuclease [Listeria seeligeri]|uniref:restriction endonuclease n=1 Tax=Listeria seeligeri TaxID=1640 RepID=UPI0022EBE685|nr:restriction endonuclease [Listeria seeligeri]